MILVGRLLKVANSVLLAACTVVSATMDSNSGLHVVRLSQIRGDAGKTNDIVFCGHRRPADSNVIFFTGDVQVNLTLWDSYRYRYLSYFPRSKGTLSYNDI